MTNEKPSGHQANWVALALVLSAPLLCCLFNPMLLMFLRSVTVVNETPLGLQVVPVSRDDRGGVGRAFLVQSQLLAVPVATDLLVQARSSTDFVYDWDDDNLCWLAVRGPAGPWKVVPGPLQDRAACALTERSNGGCCGTSSDFRFRVPPLDQLEDAPEWMVRAAALVPETRLADAKATQ